MSRFFPWRSWAARAGLAVALLLAGAHAGAQQAVNPMHPQFLLLDAEGRPTRSAPEVSEERTCGACHDAGFIAGHSDHVARGVQAQCTQCHVDGGKLDVRPETLEADGRLRREALRIGAPQARNCGSCHGLVLDAHQPVAIPANLEAAPDGSGRNASLTLGEGAIVSPSPISASFLDVQGKDRLAAPWDVHAAKLVECASCHLARNNPAHDVEKRDRLRYVAEDPRRPSTAEFLLRPDHRLATKDCRACHAPEQAHQFLPYRERHLTVLACQACHAAAQRGPAAEMIDATVATLAEMPQVTYRNVERRAGEGLNTATLSVFRPLLVERSGPDGARRLSPVNPVARWRWISRATGAEVPFSTVAAAYVRSGKYDPAILEAFDANRDGTLDAGELRVDAPAKRELVAARLRAAGVGDPAIDGTLDAYPVSHGISSRELALRDCTVCHGAGSRLGESFLVASFLPGGVLPRPPESPRVALQGLLVPTASGGLALRADDASAPGKLHVLGYSRESLTNTLGFWLFVAVALGVSIHGLARVLLRRGRPHLPPGPKVYAFGLYERIWHWTMAISGVALIVTGLQIHSGGSGWPLAMSSAVAVHNAFALVLTVNASLALFYHLVTAAIRNFLPDPRGLPARILAHLRYYARGIYFGDPHPSNEPGRKLNPLQQLTYLGLLNVLFPLQIGSGLLVWAVGRWPGVAAAVGGLHYVAPLHNAGAWLFLSFFVLHVYLVTTGRTIGEHLESMITGYQAADGDAPSSTTS
jgi:thiosulfate reductase cytochrome b subunit